MNIAIVLLALIATAFAQLRGIAITAPAVGTDITLGERLVVKVEKHDTHGLPQTDLGIVISITSLVDKVARTFFNGSFTPTQHNCTGPPFQNFTIVPTGIPTGAADVTVTHFFNLTGDPAVRWEQDQVAVDVFSETQAA
ncbi:unnamed protein product [Somion occarium]|uniref:Uncharacterized protein n=1 Tax=Somion occarium TaxID=3059160 RepID=A0ABP1DWE8_9APHY